MLNGSNESKRLKEREPFSLLEGLLYCVCLNFNGHNETHTKHIIHQHFCDDDDKKVPGHILAFSPHHVLFSPFSWKEKKWSIFGISFFYSVAQRQWRDTSFRHQKEPVSFRNHHQSLLLKFTMFKQITKEWIS